MPNTFFWGGGHKFLLYCEGTRFTPKKHQVSMEVAESKGLPTLKYHLLPRTKGFWVTVQSLRGTGEHPFVLRVATEKCPINFSENEFANQMSGGANCRCVCAPCRAAAAVYDSTLNFRNNEMPTLLGILNGKKYHADLYVR